MSMHIQWLNDGVEMPCLNSELLAQWIEQVAKSHNRIVGPLTYIFCNDTKILEVNRQYLQHDYFTDIITFDYCRGKLISGDMFISLDTVATNSEMVGDAYSRELYRVIIHGILHLCGINDKGPGEREIMEAHENAALELLNILLNK
jgi:rRNA maturation RNase YbeY